MLKGGALNDKLFTGDIQGFFARAANSFDSGLRYPALPGIFSLPFEPAGQEARRGRRRTKPKNAGFIRADHHGRSHYLHAHPGIRVHNGFAGLPYKSHRRCVPYRIRNPDLCQPHPDFRRGRGKVRPEGPGSQGREPLCYCFSLWLLFRSDSGPMPACIYRDSVCNCGLQPGLWRKYAAFSFFRPGNWLSPPAFLGRFHPVEQANHWVPGQKQEKYQSGYRDCHAGGFRLLSGFCVQDIRVGCFQEKLDRHNEILKLDSGEIDSGNVNSGNVNSGEIV